MRVHLASASNRLTPNDTSCLADEASGVYGVVDARGPTYGGWHRPIGVEPAWQALVRRLRRDDDPLPDALRLAFGDANDAALAVVAPPDVRLSHPTLSLAAVTWAGGTVSAGGVGTCRVYLRRAHVWSIVVDAQTLARSRPELELPSELRDGPAHVLGLVPAVEPEIWSDVARPGDLFIVCTATVWADRHDWLVSFAGTPEQLLEQCPALVSTRTSPASACAIFVPEDWREQRECDECGSTYFADTSRMAKLCPDCAHLLYGYPNCPHVFESGRCATCGWNGLRSAYTAALGQRDAYRDRLK